METKPTNNTSLVGGLLLILLGGAFMMATLGVYDFNWENIWPVFLIALGIVPIVQAFNGDEEHRANLVGAGTTLILLGLFFFATTLGYVNWDEQGTLWPFYVIIPGVAALVAYVASGLQRPGYLAAGIIVSVVGLGLLMATLSGFLYNFWDTRFFRRIFELDWVATWWPLAMVVGGGLFVLLGGVLVEPPTVRAGLVFAGSVPLLIGLFFLSTTLGYISWHDQGTLWPMYLLAVGVSFLFGYLASGLKLVGMLWPGVILSALALVFFAQTLTRADVFGTLWPIVLIVVGLLVLLAPRVQQMHR